MSKVYTYVTERLIEAVQESGELPWEKPWVEGHRPQNGHNKRPYNGVNTWMLSLIARLRGYSDPRWLTMHQANDRGGKVRAGEKASMVVYWNTNATRRVTDEKTGEERDQKLFLLRYYNVFNIAQIDGIELPPLPAIVREHNPLVAAEAILNGMPNKPPVTFGGDRAFYSPALDRIQMPQPEQFHSVERYYQTTFHEHSHSTGHPDRLNRFAEDEVLGFFGSAPYAKEELVAEMAAAILCNLAGIEPHRPDENHAAYVQSWVRALNNDPKMLVWAASRAEKAARYITNDLEAEQSEPASESEAVAA